MPPGQLNGGNRFQVVRADHESPPEKDEESNALISKEEAPETKVDVETGTRRLLSGQLVYGMFLGYVL